MHYLCVDLRDLFLFRCPPRALSDVRTRLASALALDFFFDSRRAGSWPGRQTPSGKSTRSNCVIGRPLRACVACAPACVVRRSSESLERAAGQQRREGRRDGLQPPARGRDGAAEERHGRAGQGRRQGPVEHWLCGVRASDARVSVEYVASQPARESNPRLRCSVVCPRLNRPRRP
jgi:hypothetical protein